jgi:hypothetical protein
VRYLRVDDGLQLSGGPPEMAAKHAYRESRAKARLSPTTDSQETTSQRTH